MVPLDFLKTVKEVSGVDVLDRASRSLVVILLSKMYHLEGDGTLGCLVSKSIRWSAPPTYHNQVGGSCSGHVGMFGYEVMPSRFLESLRSLCLDLKINNAAINKQTLQHATNFATAHIVGAGRRHLSWPRTSQ